MGFVYCFCYINLREGHTRYRLLLFYILMVSQNFGSLLLYVVISETEKQKEAWSIGATVCIILGTIIGKNEEFKSYYTKITVKINYNYSLLQEYVV